MIPSNACTLRITAAAGTELAGAYSLDTVILFSNKMSFFFFKQKTAYEVS